MLADFQTGSGRGVGIPSAPQGPLEDKWRKWIAYKFKDRPYLSLAAEEDPTHAQLLVDICASHSLISCGDQAVVVVAALDGAAEFSRACAESHSFNGADHLVEEKDAAFYVEAGHTFLACGGTLLQAGGSAAGVPHPARRLFQDACVAVFPDGDAVSAIASTVELHRVVAAHNEHWGHPWPRQLHARACVGRTFADLLPCLRHTWRGKTVVEGRVWDALDGDVVQLLLAADVRRGGRASRTRAASRADEHPAGLAILEESS
jgi:hypothetical protein